MNIKVLQFGEGNFLRAFADYYFDVLNEKTDNSYSVGIVQPIEQGRAAEIAKQPEYHVVLRGVSGGQVSETVRKIRCVSAAVNPFEDFEAYLSLALDPELKIIVSNTTEAGICFCSADRFEAELDNTYPAKLTKLLLRRFERFGGKNCGLYILPCELIDCNADRLLECVKEYIRLWNLPEEFSRWLDSEVFFCATLVDRIVTGYPAADIEHVDSLVGCHDPLVTACEPFGLWAVENKGEISALMPPVDGTIELVYADDIGYCKRRKVRVLNGSHTSLVPLGLSLGLETVYDCVQSPETCDFLKKLLDEEIIPFVDADVEKTRAYADEILNRFSNPYLNHKLLSISLNSVSKWRARVLPGFRDFYEANSALPECMTRSFALLTRFYLGAQKGEDGCFSDAFGRRLPVFDEPAVLDFFTDASLSREEKVLEFMRGGAFFGEDLTKIKGFYERTMSLL